MESGVNLLLPCTPKPFVFPEREGEFLEGFYLLLIISSLFLAFAQLSALRKLEADVVRLET